MIPRRAFLTGTAALVAVPYLARAHETPGEWKKVVKATTFAGTLDQGSLVVGKTEPDSLVTVDGNSVRVSPNGIFAFGFSFDQTKPTKIVTNHPDGLIASSMLQPVVRKYDIQKIDGLPEKYVSPPPEVLERIKRENAMVAEARKRDTAATDFVQPFDWPAKGIISGTFGSQRVDNGTPMAPHFGVDIAAPANSSICAPADGIVSLAEPDFYLTGGTTMLDHGHGVSTVYIHQNELKVKIGDPVKRGDLIGLVGMKGRATGPHLHWGMNWFQMRLDPSRSTATPAPDKA